MPVRIIATYEQPVEQFGEISGDTYYVSPGAIAAAIGIPIAWIVDAAERRKGTSP